MDGVLRFWVDDDEDDGKKQDLERSVVKARKKER